MFIILLFGISQIIVLSQYNLTKLALNGNKINHIYGIYFVCYNITFLRSFIKLFINYFLEKFIMKYLNQY